MTCNPPYLFQLATEILGKVPSWFYPSVKSYLLVETEIQGSFSPFDGTLCNQAVTGGGGDLFDCYDVGVLTPSYFTGKDGGTGWSGVWIFAHNPFGEQFGDTFDSYADGAAGTMGGGTGFSGNWGHD